MAAVHIYFASTISSYKSAIVSELSDPIECQNSETFSSFSMIYIEAKNTGCSGDIRLCVCYQQDECFRDRKDDLETLKQIENTFKCGGICNLELPMFYEGATNESCMDGIVDAIENLGLISSVSLSMGSTFAFLGFFSVVFMAIYKKKPLYKIEKHKNVNESSVWDLMQSRFDKSLGTIHTRRKFVRSPQRNPSPSPIDVMPSFVDDENAEERSEV